MTTRLISIVCIIALIASSYFYLIQTNGVSKENIITTPTTTSASRVCAYGYTDISPNPETESGCEEIIVPEHASLNSEGTDWECIAGYIKQYAHGYTEYCRLVP